MDKKIIIKFLPPNEHKHLRIIRVQGKDYNRFTAFIFYLRDFEYQELDNLDKAILESLNQSYNAEFVLNTKILFENQLDEIKNRYRLEETKNLTIQLSPIGTDDLIREMQLGREVYSYLKHFKINFLKGFNFMHFHDYFIAYLDIDELEKLEKTITPL